MRFPPAFLEDVKARLPVSEVVRRRVKLMKAGREWKGLSPFNAEKTPSFFVNDQKMAWFDFSSGRNGNIFDFVMATEGLSFPEAVERLAAEAGLTPPRATPENLAQEKKRAGLHEALALAADAFRAMLAAPEGAKARAYLDRRGIGAPARERFGLGYAPPGKYALRDRLAQQDISREVMIEAGLLVHGEDVAVPYDRFRDRLIFPICDRSGRPIAFGGRALSDDAQPKYLNSPETPLFHKGGVLFGHHLARGRAHAAGRVIVVEGYVDVVALSEAGIEEAVAPLGTALTADQAGLLWRMSEEPILCFDGDRAGRKAAWRAIDMALPLIAPGRSLKFALLPEGRDPDDLVRAGGRDAVEAVLAQALPLVEAIWRRETESADFTTPERRAAFESRLDGIAGEIRDERLRRYYKDEFRARRQALFSPRREEFSRAREGGFAGRGAGPRRLSGAPEAVRPQKLVASPRLAASPLLREGGAADGPTPREALILLMLVNHPALIDRRVEEIAEIDFAGAGCAALRDLLVEAAMDEEPPDAAGLRALVLARGLATVLARCEAAAGLSSQWFVQTEAADDDAEEVLRQALALRRRSGALNKELAEAMRAFEADSSEANWARLKDIHEQLRALTGAEASIEGFGARSGRRGGAL